MHLTSISLQGFRSIGNADVRFNKGVTTFVGENGTGKSTISFALRKLIDQTNSGDQFVIADYPYGSTDHELRVEAEFELSDQEIRDLLVEKLFPDEIALSISPLGQWLSKRPSRITASVERPAEDLAPILRWGGISIRGDRIWVGLSPTTPDGGGWIEAIARSTDLMQLTGSIFKLRRDVGGEFFAYARSRIKRFEDFRRRPVRSSSTVLESYEGTNTASVLLNSMVHVEKRERERYDLIVKTLETFFPQYKIQVVQDLGGNAPDILFYNQASGQPLHLDQVSSGTSEILTLVTNLIGTENLVIFIEHPESHLHPHAMRTLQSLILDSSGRNQIIVITHDPHFVNPNDVGNLWRFWWTAPTGTQVLSVPVDSTPRELGQMQTALRLVGQREVVFARAVILVEDESQEGFLIAIAQTLERDIDSHSISVVNCGSEDGYKPYFTLLDGLGIPYVALRDNAWGDEKRYPANRFFYFGMEIETYLDSNGLAEQRRKAKEDVGTAKRRVAAHLGGCLSRDQIPDIFDEIFASAFELATGDSVDTGDKSRAPEGPSE